MAKDDVVLQGTDMRGVHKAFIGPYQDISRLLEPSGRVFIMSGGIKLRWKGGGEFTTNSKDDGIWSGTRLEAMNLLFEEFSEKNGIININAIKGFYFEAVNTPIPFKFFEDEKERGFKVWDRFNQMWRKFELYLGANGIDVDTKQSVSINYVDAVTHIRVHTNVKNKVMTNSWVEKEGNLGVVEEFRLHSNNGLFEQLMLQPLPEDHPGYDVVDPASLYPNNSTYYSGFAHQHMNVLNPMQPSTGGPLY